jgi:UDP-3-O-[3-hydroxymyristoyl] glucosamine N-acyltransferase
VSLLLGNIVDALGGSLEGGLRDTAVLRIAPLETAGPGDISFLSHPRYQQQLAASRAACVIVAPAMREPALARGHALWRTTPTSISHGSRSFGGSTMVPAVQPGVHPSAVVDVGAVVHPTAWWARCAWSSAARTLVQARCSSPVSRWAKTATSARAALCTRVW